jgi:hypothetical protein
VVRAPWRSPPPQRATAQSALPQSAASPPPAPPPVLASVPSASVRIGGEKHFATFCATPERLVFTLNVFAADDEKRHGGGEAPVWAAPDDGANTVSLGDGMRHRGHAHRVRRHEENGTGLSRREVLFLSLPDPPVRERGSLAGRLQRRRGGGHGRRGG